MKRLFLFLLFTLQAGVLFAQGDNTISMVTYFPVPYVAYNRVKATKQMDIGLSAKPASLVLGTASTSAPLTVSGTTTVTGGALSLDFADSVTNKRLSISAPLGANAGIISLGTPNQSDMANLTFKNLTVGEIAFPAGQFLTKNGVAVSSINTDELVVNGLKLFGSDFPDCSAVNPTNGNGQIAWKQLALGPNKNSKSVYLTCGGTKTCGTKPDPDPVLEQCSVTDLVALPVVNQLAQQYYDFYTHPSPQAANPNPRLRDWENTGACGTKTHTYTCDLDNEHWDETPWEYSCFPYLKEVPLSAECRSLTVSRDVEWIAQWLAQSSQNDVSGYATTMTQQECRGSAVRSVTPAFGRRTWNTNNCKKTKAEWVQTSGSSVSGPCSPRDVELTGTCDISTLGNTFTTKETHQRTVHGNAHGSQGSTTYTAYSCSTRVYTCTAVEVQE